MTLLSHLDCRAAPSTSSTTLSAAKATLLQSLYAELQTLEAEIAAIEAAANHCTPLNLTCSLALGSSGTDVTQLQQFLVAQGDLNATPTGYFGTLTQAAVEQFQKANNISPVGSVGPITRAKITALSNSCTSAGGGSSSTNRSTGSGQVTPPPTPPDTTAPTTPTTIINYTPPTGGGGGGGGGSNPPPTPAPTLTLTSNVPSVVSGSSATITWSSQNASSCTASNAWSGSQPTSGSQTLSNLTATSTYTLVCSGSGGSTSQSVTIAVTPPPTPADTTPPSTPTNLSGSAASQTQINLTWSASTDPIVAGQSTSGVTGYQVFRNGTQIGTPITNSYNSTGLTASTTYTYKVYAIDAAGNISAASNAVTITTQAGADTTPPSVTITAPASNLAANTTQTTLSVTTNENATCAQSTNANAAFASMTLFTTTGNTSHSTTLSPLANGTAYTYYVKCKDTAGNISGNASVTFSVANPPDTTPPSVPTNLSATAVSSSAINLSWTASTDNVGVTGYDIYRGGVQIGTSATNSYSDTGLTASTQYSYTVSAYDAAGNTSTQSTSASATTQAQQTGGGGTSIIPADRLATVNWQNAGMTSVGGIPTNRTQCGTTLTPSGGDDTAQIQAALNACPAGHFVLLGPGTFSISQVQNPLIIKTSGITLRGSGAGVTILSKNNGVRGRSTNPVPGTSNPTLYYPTDINSYTWDQSPVLVVGPNRYVHPYRTNPGDTSVNLTADGAQGATSVTVASTAGFAVGQIVLIDELSGATWQPTPVGFLNNNTPGTAGTVKVWEGDRVVWNMHWPTQTYQDDSANANAQGPYDTTPGVDPAAMSWFSRTDRPTNELKEIASISGNTITFTSPLTLSYRVSHTAQLTWYPPDGGGGNSVHVKNICVENLTISGGADGNLRFENAAYSWAKNVEITQWLGEGVAIDGSFRIELRDSYIHTGAWPINGGGGYAISLSDGSSEALIENNISIDVNKVMVFRSSGAGSVVAYNYTDNGWIGDGTNAFFSEAGINASHMAGSHDVLFEGNYSFKADADFTHGNSIYMTFFRNDLSGKRRSFADDPTQTINGYNYANINVASAAAYSWWYSFVGNVLGRPGQMGAFRYTDPSMSCDANGNNCTGNNASWSDPDIWRYGVDPERWSMQPEPITLSTMIRDGNYDYLTNSQHWHNTPGGFTIPNSMYLTSKPAFFGTCMWPWVDPTTGTTYTLPAKARYDAGTPNTIATNPCSGGTTDTTPPSTPTSLAATAVSSSAINLTWTASTDNVGVTGYNIYRGGIQVGTSGSTSYSDTGLIASTQYTYTVAAYDAEGNNSAQSSSASATTQAAAGDTTPPSVPTNLVASAVSSSAINLTWTASTDNVGVTGYKIFRGGTQVGTVTTNSDSDSGLSASTQYTYTVSAYDAAGNNSAQSGSASATTQSSGGGGGGTISYVQTVKTLNDNETASFTSNSITTSSGDMLVVALALWSQVSTPPTVSSITLDGTTNFTVDKTQVATSNNAQRVVIASLRNVPAGTHTVTVTATGNISVGSALFVSEFSGAVASAPVDGSGAAIDGYSSTPSGGTFTTSAGNDLWVSTFSTTGDTTSITPGTGWTIPTNGANLSTGGIGYPVAAFEYQIANNKTSGNGSFTLPSVYGWAAAAIAYKAQ